MKSTACLLLLLLVVLSNGNRHWHLCSYLKGANMDGGDRSLGDATFLAFINDETNQLFYTVNVPFDFTAITLINTNINEVMETLVSSSTPIPAGEYSVAHAQTLNYVQKINLKGQNAAIRISTEAFPDGAVEGKVWHKKVFFFKAEMDPEQELHTVVPNGNAVGVSNSKVENLDNGINLRWSVRHTLNVADHGLTSAHFHGPANQKQSANPLSVIAFGEGAESPVSDAVEPMADVNVADDIFSYFMEGLMYTNFHTELNPVGELRGHCLRVRSPRFTVNPLRSKFVVPSTDADFTGKAKKIIFNHELNYIQYIIDTGIPKKKQRDGGFFGEASKGSGNGVYQVNLRYGTEKPDVRKKTLVKGTVALFDGVKGGPEGMFEAFIKEKYSIQYERVNKGAVVRGQIRNWDWNKRKLDWQDKKKRSFVLYSDMFP